MMYWDGGWGGGWILMLLVMFSFWALVIVGVVALVRYTGRDTHPPYAAGGRQSAEGILDERFARGEIGEEEYTRRRQVLRDDG
jgi:putative membrane protein